MSSSSRGCPKCQFDDGNRPKTLLVSSPACWHPETNIYGESSLEGIFVAGDGSGIAGASAAILAGKTAAKHIVQYSQTLDFYHLAFKVKRYKHVAARPFLDNLFRPPKGGGCLSRMKL